MVKDLSQFINFAAFAPNVATRAPLGGWSNCIADCCGEFCSGLDAAQIFGLEGLMS